MAGLPKRVVLRKPQIKKPIDKKDVKSIKPDEDPKLIEHPLQDMIKDTEDELDIPEENHPTVIHTESKRLILAKKIPEPAKIIAPVKKSLTFDDKVMDRLNIKSKINNDEVIQDKIKKPEIKETRQPKLKKKIKLTVLSVVSLILAVIMTIWTFNVVNAYLSGNLDGSLASFIYTLAMVLLTIILYVWFIVERLKGDKKNDR
jgi:hypothetical protein